MDECLVEFLRLAFPNELRGASSLDGQRFRLLAGVLLAAFGITLVFMMTVFAAGDSSALPTLLGLLIVYGLGLVGLRRGWSLRLLAHVYLAISLSTMTAIALPFDVHDGAVLVWFVTIPVAACALRGARAGIMWGLLSAALVGIVVVLGQEYAETVARIIGPPVVITQFQRFLCWAFAVVFMLSLFCAYDRGTARAAAELAGKTRELADVQAEVRDENRKLACEIAERQRAECERVDLTERLGALSRLAGQAEISTAILHDIGNALVALNGQRWMLSRKLEVTVGARYSRALSLTAEHSGSDVAALIDFAKSDPRAEKLWRLLRELGALAEGDRTAIGRDADALRDSIDHIDSLLLSHAGAAYAPVAVRQKVEPSELIERAVELAAERIDATGASVACDAPQMSAILVDRHKILQILLNLIVNACDAVSPMNPETRQVTVRCRQDEQSSLIFSVTDSGVGISEADLDRIFGHGFSMKSNGLGFGLHGSAVAAAELGGTLRVESDGPGKGAEFTLMVPVGQA